MEANMNVNGVTPTPAVYLSPQVWAPNVPGDMPIALALAAHPEPTHKARKEDDETARKAADEVRRVTMHPNKPVSTVDLTGEGRHVDLYV
jgi:hypothetical protein